MKLCSPSAAVIKFDTPRSIASVMSLIPCFFQMTVKCPSLGRYFVRLVYFLINAKNSAHYLWHPSMYSLIVSEETFPCVAICI